MFVGSRIQNALWPEIMGVLTYAGSALVAAAMDAARVPEDGTPGTPWIQNGVTAVSLIGGTVALGYGKAPDFAKGLIFGSGAGLALTLMRSVYDRVGGQPTAVKMSDVGALVPRRIQVTPALPSARGRTVETLGAARRAERTGQLSPNGADAQREVSDLLGLKGPVPAAVATDPRYQ